MGAISEFVDRHFLHFNAAALRDAARDYGDFVDGGGKMLLTLGGAMSTAELGKTVAEMIRADKVHAICCTGANLEEDIFNLIAHDFYERVPNYRDLTVEDEARLLERGMNRVTDTCIPEEEALRRLEHHIERLWQEADRNKESYLPHEFLFRLLREKTLESYFQIDPRDSWMIAACEKKLPMFVPGWEDSTLGNMFAAQCYLGKVSNPGVVRGGVNYFLDLAHWYRANAEKKPVGMFQIGGGIAGDFPICVVPMLHQDCELTEVPRWAFFCQISDATTSYGSYSGAPPREKITWGKLDAKSRMHVIESDATIVAPLLFAYVLGW